MSNNQEGQKPVDKTNEDALVKPEPETLHTPDPQDNMKGPISSLIHGAGETFDTDKSKEEADEEKEKNM